MQGKTVVMTGATSGIGEVAALARAEQGARIVFVARDASRGESLLARLRRRAVYGEHVMHLADLSRVAEMRRIGAQIAASEPRIHVLLNNAGAIFETRQLTGEGFEETFALNHLSYFVVTHELLPRLTATPGARIVSTASEAHRLARLDFNDLQSDRGYRGYRTYGRSKLMNILFTRELARRIAASKAPISANCHHPGFVATRFGESQRRGLATLAFRTARWFARSPEEGARTMLYLAASPELEGVSGRYFCDCRPVAPSKSAQSDEDARRLWAISAELAGLSGSEATADLSTSVPPAAPPGAPARGAARPQVSS
jgi:NAD(P)-dependent dehydrogenase (short-subunit alcohol dehydrogenase family)